MKGFLKIAAAATVMMAAGAVAHAEDPADVAGAWDVTMTNPMGTQTDTMTLEQDGATATGTLGESEVSVAVEGATVSFEAQRTTPMGEMTMAFTGEVDGDSISGEYEVVGMGFPPASWEAERSAE